MTHTYHTYRFAVFALLLTLANGITAPRTTELSAHNTLALASAYAATPKDTPVRLSHLSSLQTMYARTGASTQPLIPEEELSHTCHLFEDAMLTHLDSSDSLNGDYFKRSSRNFMAGRRSSIFQPFAQRLVVPANSSIAFWGDLHGDLPALLASLENLIARGYLKDDLSISAQHPDFFMIFLGDYTDRGEQGAEVLYLLMRLKIMNPDHVFLVRGNHEDYDLNARYGFHREIQAKYPGTVGDELRAQISNLYNLMPVVLFLGSGRPEHLDFIQCCHGGIEVGYSARDLLRHPITPLTPSTLERIIYLPRADAVTLLPQKHQEECAWFAPHLQNFYPQTPTYPYTLGFMWSDVILGTKKNVLYQEGRGLAFGKELTHHLFAAQSDPTPGNERILRGMFRAHQHNDVVYDGGSMMPLLAKYRGIVRSWAGQKPLLDPHAPTVLTFLSAPTVMGLHGEYSYGMLQTAPTYQEWVITHARS